MTGYQYHCTKPDMGGRDFEALNKQIRDARAEWQPNTDCGTRRGWDRHRKLRQPQCDRCVQWRIRFQARAS